MVTVDTHVVCDGVRIDKNVVPAYLQQVQAGTANWSIESAFYSGTAKRCQSGNCNHAIHNVFVVKDNTTGTTYEVGSECVAKYCGGLERIVAYWKAQLEQAKGRAIRTAKHEAYMKARQERAANSQVENAEEIAFIEKYLKFKPSPFMESIKQCFTNGWELSEKQSEIFYTIMEETDFDELAKQCDAAVLQFDRVLSVFEKLDRVSFGQYPSSAYHNIRMVFAQTGMITDKQLGLLEKLVHRFRRQVDKA